MTSDAAMEKHTKALRELAIAIKSMTKLGEALNENLVILGRSVPKTEIERHQEFWDGIISFGTPSGRFSPQDVTIIRREGD